MKHASKQWHNNSDQHTKGRDMLVRTNACQTDSDQHTKGRDMLVRTNACQTDRGLASDVWTVALNEILR